VEEEDELLRSPGLNQGANIPRRSGPRPKPTKEGLKALSEYKAGLKIIGRLENSTTLTKEEEERLK